jgi:2-amino-4-hydroxy-6-hydroxymethyldihydropteridine diphosphokinase
MMSNSLELAPQAIEASDAILGLGSNVGHKVANIDDAIARLAASGDVHIKARSQNYRSAPWGVLDQDWFVNACVSITTKLTPHELLAHCQSVERDMGRVRELRWGPRVIDVDILTYGTIKIDDPNLVVPHPLIAQRGFVLVPLRDVAPNFHMNGQSISQMIDAMDVTDIVPIFQ